VADAVPEFEGMLQLRMLPNPFRSDLKVQLRLPQASEVSIIVYDAMGKVVQQVVRGQHVAGLQEFRIDGSRWSNGTYFCEVVVNNQRTVRKLTLSK
jgi:flagellar hook assembly protein FlgD